MTPALLALGSALCYGLVDVAGGLLARRSNPVRVALAAQVGALVLTLAALLMVPASAVTTSDLLWGAASGVGTGLGMLFLYRGLAHGDFSLVVPLASIGGVVIPVAAGVVLLGDRPSAVAWIGMAIAVPALWALLHPGHGVARSTSGSADALIAGIGIAIQYLALAQADADARLWPIAAGRITAIAAVAPFTLRAAPDGRMGLHRAAAAALTGGGAALALFLYLLAVDEGMLTVAVVLASLYPVVPVVLGLVSYAEAVTRTKLAGLTAALLAVALLSTG